MASSIFNLPLVVNESKAVSNDQVIAYLPLSVDMLTSIVYFDIENNNTIGFEHLSGVSCSKTDCKVGPFSNRKLLILHILSAHRGIWFICGSCSLGFITEDHRIRHTNSLHKDEIFQDKMLQINISAVLAKEHTTYFSVSKPITCKIRMDEGLFMGCHFLLTLQTDGTEFNTKVMLRSCLENPILTVSESCPFREINNCQQLFETCRDVIFHLTSFHFHYKAFCIICLALFTNSSDIGPHMADVHKECVSCFQMFKTSLNINNHIHEIKNSITPYIEGYPDDLRCALCLPNIAFHFSNIEKVSFDKVEGSHACANLVTHINSIDTLLDNPIMTRSDMIKIDSCLISKIIVYPSEIMCNSPLCVGDATFRYKNCRELLVHKLLKHGMWTNFRYLCNLCTNAVGKPELPLHIIENHGRLVCFTCLLSYKTELSLQLHHFTCGHKVV